MPQLGIVFAGVNGLDLKVAPGELIGILTTSPEASTLLRRLLGREIDPATGVITLDGNPLNALAPSVIRRAILVSPHDSAA